MIKKEANKMFEIIDTFPIGDKLSITVKGNGDELKNGMKLKDDSGHIYEVLSVAMVEHNSPKEIASTTTLLTTSGDLSKNEELFVVK